MAQQSCPAILSIKNSGPGHFEPDHRPFSRAIALAGPSGVGKSTVIKALMERYPDLFEFSLSATTRPPRAGEVNGKDYHFLGREEFVAKLQAGEFVESANVHENYYGTTRQAVESVLAKGKIWLKDIDVCGCSQLRRCQLFRPLFIMVTAPSEAELERRLRGRGTDSEEVIQRRLRNALEELRYKDCGLFDEVLVNDNVEDCVSRLDEMLRRHGLLPAKN